ncbi:MAG: hypothetical protein ACRC2T_01415 [Thermoguttaceae bacterium]
MPKIEDAKTIEEMYWNHVRSMSPAERFEKMLQLNRSVNAFSIAGIKLQHPDLEGRDLLFALARKRYWDDPEALHLIDVAEQKEKAGNDK